MGKTGKLFGTRGTPAAQPQPSGSTRSQQYNDVTWVDIENPGPQDIDKLATAYPFHPLHLEAGLLDDSLPQQERETTYIFLLLHVPVFDKAQGKTVVSKVAIFLGKKYLITLHTDQVGGIRKLFEQCEQDEAQRDAHFKDSSGYLLYSVVNNIFDEIAGLAKSVLRELDQTEDDVFDTSKSDAAAIATLRQKVLRLRRATAPLKTVVADLPASVKEVTGENLSHYYRNIVRTANWLSEIIDEAGETIEIYKDADFTASSERTNQILAILTIVFTLAIPATVIGTFYGMNILLPGGIEIGAWTFLGTYTTLILILAASLIPGIIMYWYFKRKHWF